MFYVGIDVAKDKHDCIITGSDGEALVKPFTIPNSRHGFDELLVKIKMCGKDFTKMRIGLEATGHYCNNLLLCLDH